MLNFRLAAPEILNILKDATPRAFMVHAAYQKTIAEIASQLGFVDHFIFIGSHAETPPGRHPYETLIIASPLFHATGEVTLMNDVYSGTASVIMLHWDTQLFLQLVQEHHITTGMLATPMLLFLVDYPDADQYDTSSLKKIFFAGAPVTPVVYKRAVKRFGNVFLHLFGTTETVGQTTILKIEEIARALASGKTYILASCGRSFTDMESVVVDENDVPVAPGAVGEVKVRGLGTTFGH